VKQRAFCIGLALAGVLLGFAVILGPATANAERSGDHKLNTESYWFGNVPLDHVLLRAGQHITTCSALSETAVPTNYLAALVLAPTYILRDRRGHQRRPLADDTQPLGHR